MDGILLINKESGYTSHDVVNVLRKKLMIKSIGHIGTLDPLAKGLLVCLVGSSTKYAKYFEEHDKTYIAEITIGATSETLDMGSELKYEEPFELDLNIIDEALSSFKGQYFQAPPMYSAVKINGKKLYEYARKNIMIEREKKEFTVYNIERISDLIKEDYLYKFRVRVRSSKGLYIRVLASDIGQKLGHMSLLSDLIRVNVGDFSLDDAKSLDEVNQEMKLINPLDYLTFLEKVKVSEESVIKKISNGAFLDKTVGSNELILLFDQKGPLAIYRLDEEKNLYRMDLKIRG